MKRRKTQEDDDWKNNKKSGSSSSLSSSACVPRKTKTGLVIGQDLFSITNYTAVFPENRMPFGLMAYTTLKNENGELTGLKSPINYGSGIEWTSGLLELFPASSIQLGLYLVDQLDQIISGEFDKLITELADYVLQSRRTFYLRIGYEFDLPGNHYDRESFISSFRRIVDIFRKKKVENALFVWHGTGEDYHDYQNNNSHSYFSKWFPGREFVDFCGVSIFEQPFHCQRRRGGGGDHSIDSHGDDPSVCKMDSIERFFDFCLSFDIPLMIAESTPFGGIVSSEEEEGIGNKSAVNRAGYPGDSWSVWFEPVLSLIERYEIRLWSYVNNDWDSLPMWQKNHAPGVFWGDSRVQGE
jgi:hypothetical protein